MISYGRELLLLKSFHIDNKDFKDVASKIRAFFTLLGCVNRLETF